MIKLENLVKIYQTGGNTLKAIDNINLEINKGEFIVLCGPSGSGKTTLLMAIGAMLRPTSGKVSIEENSLYDMSTHARAKFRAQNIGFVFQMFHLVPYLNITENVILPAGAINKNSPTDEAEKLLKQLGLTQRAGHRPSQLSAGEKQRTAIARAMFNHPKIILADEPTGNLDSENADAVYGYLADFHSRGGTVIVATHGPQAHDFADRTINLRNGRIDN